MESLSKFLSQCVTIGSGLLASGFGAAALNSGNSVAWGLTSFSLGAAALGGISWVFAHRRAKVAYANRQEQRMIAVAKDKQGRLTDVELVAETRYPLEECRAFLKRMTDSGSAEINIGPEGTMVYLFPGFLSDEQKRTAESVGAWKPPLEKQASQEGSPPPLESSSDKGSESQGSNRSLELEQ